MPNFIPALHFKWLTPFYDWLLPLLFPENQFRKVVSREARLAGNEFILDLGCGTGTLIRNLKAEYSGAKVLGVDIDLEILRIAKWKAARNGLKIQFVNCSGDAIPFRTGSFDAVVSTLVFHHLSSWHKIKSLSEIARILRNAGKLVIGDLGAPRTTYTCLVSKLLSKVEPTSDNIHGRIPEIIQQAGFNDVCEVHAANTLFGSLSITTARKTKGAQSGGNSHS